MADAVVRKKQDTLTVRTTQQTIRLDILNAITNVESSKESVKLAKVARDFAQKSLDAENKKYELGTELSQNVLLRAERPGAGRIHRGHQPDRAAQEPAQPAG